MQLTQEQILLNFMWITLLSSYCMNYESMDSPASRSPALQACRATLAVGVPINHSELLDKIYVAQKMASLLAHRAPLSIFITG